MCYVALLIVQVTIVAVAMKQLCVCVVVVFVVVEFHIVSTLRILSVYKNAL